VRLNGINLLLRSPAQGKTLSRSAQTSHHCELRSIVSPRLCDLFRKQHINDELIFDFSLFLVVSTVSN
jgi:hypothetical protein